MQKRIIHFTLLMLLSISSCKGPLKTLDGITPEKPLEFKLQAGTNKGGIVENTDILKEPGVAVDAFSGATKKGFNVGARLGIPVNRNAIETGLDLMYNQQTFNYQDLENGFIGERKLDLSQIMIPLTWNFGLLNHPKNGRLVELKLGPVLQYNILSTCDEGENLPDFSYNKISAGVSFGISVTPFTFNSGSRLGFFVEGYRGGQIYEDFYNQSHFEITGSSFSKFGVVFQFKSKSFQ